MPAKKGSPLPLAALIGAALLALLLSILALANPVASQLEHDDLSARAAKKTYQRAPFVSINGPSMLLKTLPDIFQRRSV